MKSPKEWVLIECGEVVVPDRARKDMGDIDGLAESIRSTTLLQPIGVTPKNVLVFGERRLRAVRDVLGLPKIHARVIDLDDPLQAENDENECRKEFTHSERVAIARAIEAKIGDRHGQRTDLQLGDNCPQVAPGVKTADAAAGQAGFANAKEYRRAATVVDRGTPALVAAMDAGEVSVSAAAQVATLPEDVQAAVVEAGPKAVKAKAKKVREAKAECDPAATQQPATDEKGTALPPKAVPAFAGVDDIKQACGEIDALSKRIAEIKATPAGTMLMLSQVQGQLKTARDSLWYTRPYAVCPRCEGVKAHCVHCDGRGWITKRPYDSWLKEAKP